MILYYSKSIDPARISSPTTEKNRKLGASGGFLVQFMRVFLTIYGLINSRDSLANFACISLDNESFCDLVNSIGWFCNTGSSRIVWFLCTQGTVLLRNRTNQGLVIKL